MTHPFLYEIRYIFITSTIKKRLISILRQPHYYLFYLDTIKFFSAFSKPFTVNGNILNSPCINL
ncbi:hypothetical protein C4097_02710 [Clostridioides difficile]|nr:hypothetical protein [Clostridioides difficile]